MGPYFLAGLKDTVLDSDRKGGLSFLPMLLCFLLYQFCAFVLLSLLGCEQHVFEDCTVLLFVEHFGLGTLLGFRIGK